jgi:hypothetical protein
LEEYCKEQGRLVEASEEGLGSKGAVVPMMMMMMILPASQHFTKLDVSVEHTRFHHAGPQLLIASLRKWY